MFYLADHKDSCTYSSYKGTFTTLKMTDEGVIPFNSFTNRLRCPIFAQKLFVSKNYKNQEQILQKLGIKELNAMQVEAQKAIFEHNDLILLSPTGTGKTLAFLLPIIALLDPDLDEIQALIVVPARELALQIEQVVREMGSGFKTNAVYGGRAGIKDRNDLKHPPAILIGTPGRIADHIRRENISTAHINYLILDEFDKSLEVGFEKEMKEIYRAMTGRLEKKILTSATHQIELPDFLHLSNVHQLDFLNVKRNQLTIKVVESIHKDKLEALERLLLSKGDSSGIVFCNYKDTIQFVSSFLKKKKISHGTFYGGLEQFERERALVQFRNGTHRILISTDLAARGIDVPEMDFIVHYQLPFKKEEFTHRNGRTARMHSTGIAYVLKFQEEELPMFIEDAGIEIIETQEHPKPSNWRTLFISAGRKDKISKGDIAGLFFKQGQLNKDELGLIEIKQDCAFVAVPRKKAFALVKKLDQTRIKKRKVRITVVE